MCLWIFLAKESVGVGADDRRRGFRIDFDLGDFIVFVDASDQAVSDEKLRCFA